MDTIVVSHCSSVSVVVATHRESSLVYINYARVVQSGLSLVFLIVRQCLAVITLTNIAITGGLQLSYLTTLHDFHISLQLQLAFQQ